MNKKNMPACFDSDSQWDAYCAAMGSNKDYCRDCTPEYKDQMVACKRCDHLETVFIQSNDDFEGMIGVSVQQVNRSWPWQRALMGVDGPVILMPRADVVDRMLASIPPAPVPREKTNKQEEPVE